MKWLIQVSKTSIYDCSMLERKLCLYFPPSTLVVTISNWYTERESTFFMKPRTNLAQQNDLIYNVHETAITHYIDCWKHSNRFSDPQRLPSSPASAPIEMIFLQYARSTTHSRTTTNTIFPLFTLCSSACCWFGCHGMLRPAAVGINEYHHIKKYKAGRFYGIFIVDVIKWENGNR